MCFRYWYCNKIDHGRFLYEVVVPLSGICNQSIDNRIHFCNLLFDSRTKQSNRIFKLYSIKHEITKRLVKSGTFPVYRLCSCCHVSTDIICVTATKTRDFSPRFHVFDLLLIKYRHGCKRHIHNANKINTCKSIKYGTYMGFKIRICIRIRTWD